MIKYLICFLLLATNIKGQVNIIPKPLNTNIKEGAPFVLNTTLVVSSNDSVASKKSESYLRNYLNKYYQFKLPATQLITSNIGNVKSLTFKIDKIDSTNNNSYRLKVSNDEISIVAQNDTGLFYGMQSLLQLIPTEPGDSLKIPQVEVYDRPRFAYRGMHLDVSRHFFDIEFIKKYIDYLAFHKLNYFHWHLTDDQGWRIEIKKYPNLTQVGAWRNGTIIGLYPGKGNDGLKYGGFYTQEQIKEVIAYANERYITIIPEIEMPAHSMALLASYPEYGTQPTQKYQVAQTWGIFNKLNNVLQPTEKTIGFMQDILTEVIALFPSKYIHVGGDEASTLWWKQSPTSQKIKQQLGLKTDKALQNYFMARIGQFVASKGKTMIGWDEILDGGAPKDAVAMSWRGELGAIKAAKSNHKVIMAPEDFLYFNHKQFFVEDSLTAQRFVPLEKVYNYEPIPSSLTASQKKMVWGVQGNLWTEYINSPKKVDYMLFPRIDALSEMGWATANQKNYADFRARLKEQLKRYDLMGIGYSKRYLNN